MARFIIQRLAIMGPMVLLVLTISFVLVRLAPGSPFVSEGRQLPEAVLKNLNEKYNLDAPLHKQYAQWLGRVLHFDFGSSLKYTDRTVNEIIGESITVSAGIGLVAYLIALVVGWLTGALAAIKHNTWLDSLASGVSTIGVALPNFVLGPLLVVFFSLTLYWLPPARLEWAAVIGPIELHWLIVGLSMLFFLLYLGLAYLAVNRLLVRLLGRLLKNQKQVGWTSVIVTGLLALGVIVLFARQFMDWQGVSFPLTIKLPTLRTILLPAVTLSFAYLAYIARLTRTGLLETLRQDYIRTARAKGLSEWRVLFRHALRGGILPVVSFSGPALAFLIAGTVVIERIFAVPGLGSYFINAAFNRDYFLLLGITAFIATLLMLMNLIVDIVYVLIDPRIRYE